jgi:hypothetical protein
MNLTPFFNQYLRTVKIPVFEYSAEETALKYRWNNCVDGFAMPLKVKIGESEKWLKPQAEWSELKIPAGSEIKADPNFYIFTKNLNEKKGN